MSGKLLVQEQVGVASPITCRSIILSGFREKCEILPNLDIPVSFNIQRDHDLNELGSVFMDQASLIENTLIQEYKLTRDSDLSLFVRSLDFYEVRCEEGFRIEWEFTCIRCCSPMSYIVGLDNLVYFNISKPLKEVIH
jgi:hypothetical protein